MRTLKRRVSQFIPQCDELIQFSSPSVQRVVRKITIKQKSTLLKYFLGGLIRKVNSSAGSKVGEQRYALL